jgi:hypothetical protein
MGCSTRTASSRRQRPCSRIAATIAASSAGIAAK